MLLSASTWKLYTCTRSPVQSGISCVIISCNMETVHMYTVSCSIWYFVCYYQLQHGNCTHVHGLLFSLVFRMFLSALTWKLYTCKRFSVQSGISNVLSALTWNLYTCTGTPVQSGISYVFISFNMETVHMYTVSCSVW